MTETKIINSEWLKIKPSEVEKTVIDLHKKGNTPAKIGLILRDQHGIPKAKLIGKRISKIIKENGFNENSEKIAIDKKIKNLKNHISKHKHDYTAKRSISKKLWITAKIKS